MPNALSKESSPGSASELDAFNAGLGNLRIYIELRLEEKGAKLGAGSLMHSRWPMGIEPPAELKIYVVPFNSRGIEAAFGREEIVACQKGVVRAEVAAKVQALVEKFVESSGRYLQAQQDPPGPER